MVTGSLQLLACAASKDLESGAHDMNMYISNPAQYTFCKQACHQSTKKNASQLGYLYTKNKNKITHAFVLRSRHLSHAWGVR